MNANLSKEQSKNRRATAYGASLTAAPITEIFGHTAGALQSALRAEVIVGRVVVATAITAQHRHSNLVGLWVNGKDVSITASTNTSCTANASTDILTAAGHGLVDNQPIVLGGTAVPGGTSERTIYWARVLNANTFQLRPAHDSASTVDLTDAGSSVQFTPVRSFSITYLPTVAGDQSHMPIRPNGQVVITTGAGDACDVLSVRVNQED